MERTRYTEKRIAFALKQAELGMPVPAAWRKMGIPDATFTPGARNSEGYDSMTFRAEAFETAGGESAPEASGGGSEPGQSHATEPDFSDNERY